MENFDFYLGVFVSSIISYAICSSYADITMMYQEMANDMEKSVEFWMKYYNKKQKEFFG
ncbi:MAG: hypothetical protein BWY47_01535 [Bacteroidetes bacterium ADurb.Bin302]|nr:MAG: hypothetical protein BWY47_01535 [Bacteroidetes bacterium ADurb.Bin302]